MGNSSSLHTDPFSGSTLVHPLHSFPERVQPEAETQHDPEKVGKVPRAKPVRRHTIALVDTSGAGTVWAAHRSLSRIESVPETDFGPGLRGMSLDSRIASVPWPVAAQRRYSETSETGFVTNGTDDTQEALGRRRSDTPRSPPSTDQALSPPTPAPPITTTATKSQPRLPVYTNTGPLAHFSSSPVELSVWASMH
ncbi:hypothetical protein BC830DRAFT_127200 [Chytriomyces sp. MP71]|nr:hypothetical protein BC830DRAFT_127200 [Chytriomyces sp. MP71]